MIWAQARVAGGVIGRTVLLAGLSAAMLGILPSGLRSALAQGAPEIVTPVVDAARGRDLFVRKACVVCHSVNGIGGGMAPPLDAPSAQAEIDIADFAARMWRGAGPMVWLQTLELGYQIDLTGEDIAHLAGFANDRFEQSRFEENQVPGRILDSLLTEPYQRPEDWMWIPEPE